MWFFLCDIYPPYSYVGMAVIRTVTFMEAVNKGTEPFQTPQIFFAFHKNRM